MLGCEEPYCPSSMRAGVKHDQRELARAQQWTWCPYERWIRILCTVHVMHAHSVRFMCNALHALDVHAHILCA